MRKRAGLYFGDRDLNRHKRVSSKKASNFITFSQVLGEPGWHSNPPSLEVDVRVDCSVQQR